MEIRTYGDPTLRRRAKPVEAIGDGIRTICEQMVETMLRANGAGLAAPQIGISKRIIVLDVEGEFHVLINPELIETSDEVEQQHARRDVRICGPSSLFILSILSNSVSPVLSLSRSPTNR